ncbi:isoprenylcysteine carboxylmethyltransferase family protein [Haloferax sp. AB510]|uniref:methyltransferase family protein n=1 Tax=Haloferax sp. AB510 TaxID=2934172 RepID=UPI00209C35FE|nr:isoprenylcysteine carboxylmethyltransferase family protein [Haloferax sp. AB510]MCO8265147.1 isoprenylcysteine carboxylmethyltransferase family protein [Haloferax sp. AB510]
MILTPSKGLLGLGLVVGLGNLAGVWASILGYNSYYPLGERNYQFYLFWGLSYTLNLVLLGLGILQFGMLGLPRWVLYLGVMAMSIGFGIVLVSTSDLGVEQTQGLEGELRTDGLYRYSRNPQYVGYILATVGYVFITGSPFVVLLCCLYLAWWLSFPLAEEPWLHAQFGEDYTQYMGRVPRFIGLRTVQLFVEQERGPTDNT